MLGVLTSQTVLVAVCGFLLVVPCLGAVLNVPSEYPTIHAAVDAAADGDSIVVAPGSYAEGRIGILGKVLSVVGAGRDATFLSSAPTMGFLIDKSHVAMTGFDITSGGGAGAAPSFLVGDATLTLTSCRIHDSNGGGEGGGAIETAGRNTNVICVDVLFIGNNGIAGAVYISGGNIAHFTRCRFENNVTNRNINSAGAVHVSARDVQFVDCDFIDNRSTANYGGIAGGVYFTGELGGTLLMERCILVGNEGTDCGAIVAEDGGSATIRNCTIDGNTGSRDFSAVCVGLSGATTPTRLEHCIITRNGPKPALSCIDGALTVECCDVWGNADDTVCPGGSNNIAADPQFCGADRWDLQADSPCAPGHTSTCGLIGARDVGCGVDAMQPSTWGGIKATWRDRWPVLNGSR